MLATSCVGTWSLGSRSLLSETVTLCILCLCTITDERKTPVDIYKNVKCKDILSAKAKKNMEVNPLLF